MGQFAFSEEEDDGSFVESMKNQSDQGDVEELPVQQLGTGFSDEEDDGSFVMPEQDDFEDAEIAIPEDQQRPVIETLDGQKNNTHIREDVEEEQSDRSLIGRAYDDIKGFVTSPVEVLSTVPRAVSGGLGELTQFIGDLDLKRQQLTGTLKFDLGEDQKFNISDIFQIPEYVSPSEVKKK